MSTKVITKKLEVPVKEETKKETALDKRLAKMEDHLYTLDMRTSFTRDDVNDVMQYQRENANRRFDGYDIAYIVIGAAYVLCIGAFLGHKLTKAMCYQL